MKTNSGYKTNSEFGMNTFAYFKALDNSTLELDANTGNTYAPTIPVREYTGAMSTMRLNSAVMQDDMYSFQSVPLQVAMSYMFDNSIFSSRYVSGTSDIDPIMCYTSTGASMLSAQVIMHQTLSGQTFTLSRYLDSGVLVELASNCIYAVLYRQANTTGTNLLRQIVMGYAYTTSGMKLINFDTGSYTQWTTQQHRIRVQSTSAGSAARMMIYTLVSKPKNTP